MAGTASQLYNMGLRLFLVVCLLLLLAVPARALTILRDPDIEYALGKLAAPIINAAGLPRGQIRILVVKDPKLNAFVVDSRHVLLNSGLILKLKSAEELQAVIAHEIAHIANGHITRRMANQRAARSAAGFGFAVAMAVAASTNNSRAAAGVAIGASSSATRVFLGHTRAEEASADQSAMSYMAQAGLNPGALADVFDYFRGQEVLNAARQDPYVRSHPLSRDRIRAVKGRVAALPAGQGSDPTSAYWFARAKGKLGAFLQAPSFTLRRIKKNDTSDVAILRRAVAYHRKPDPARATAEIAKLIRKRPNDAFVHELHGQILLESRQYSAAVSAYGRAVKLDGRNALILAGYGRALLALNTADSNRRALRVLEDARSRDGRDARMLRDLATAYARAGQNGMASVVTAERYALRGDLKSASIHAKRAVGLLPQGSRGWNRAQDVLNAAKRAG